MVLNTCKECTLEPDHDIRSALDLVKLLLGDLLLRGLNADALDTELTLIRGNVIDLFSSSSKETNEMKLTFLCVKES